MTATTDISIYFKYDKHSLIENPFTFNIASDFDF